jgi:hypothetical protein
MRVVWRRCSLSLDTSLWYAFFFLASNLSIDCTHLFPLSLFAADSQHPPKHTIVFAFFDAEETGYLGSKEFLSCPPIALDRIALNVNLDMISHNFENELDVTGLSPDHYPFLRPYVVRAAQGGTVTVVENNGSNSMWYAAVPLLLSFGLS